MKYLCQFCLMMLWSIQVSFSQTTINDYGPHKLIAHRGGIVEGRYPENSSLSIQAAIERGYWMVEVDVRISKDGVLISHHDRNFDRFYGDKSLVSELTLEEIKALKTTPWNTECLTFEELAKMCQGKIALMVDTKDEVKSRKSFKEIERILREYELLEDAYFIGTRKVRNYFKGKARIGANRSALREAVKRGEPVSQGYFLFEHGNELNIETVRWAQSLNVPIVPSVNVFHYRSEPHMAGAKRDIFWLKKEGVTEFQIDSQYDRWLISEKDELTQGPFIGHLSSSTAKIWTRAADTGYYAMELMLPNEQKILKRREATIENDLCISWDFSGLEGGSLYVYTLYGKGKTLTNGTFITPIQESLPQRSKLVFGSCARDKTGVAYPIWDRIREQHPDALVLLGDTPYIDSTDPDYQQRRYREFYQIPELQKIIHYIPIYSIWDDHDFGLNDTYGDLEGKDQSREAFMLYRSNPSYGQNGKGLYTSFRRGPMEVFLLDTRWFAAQETVDGRASLLGKAQTAWLKSALKQSTAPFKILACGMIWNEATRPNKKDHWGKFLEERDRLFKFFEMQDISGVILVGGDIHRSRHLKHSVRAMAGYDIHEFISSPMHDGIIEAANAPHKDLVKDMGEPESFLVFEASNTTAIPVLTASFKNVKGEILHQVVIRESDLHRP